MKKSVFLILFAVLLMMAVSFLSVSAQGIDLTNMSSEELSALAQLLQQIQQGNMATAEETTPTPIPVPTETPVPAANYSEEELLQLLFLLQQLQQIDPDSPETAAIHGPVSGPGPETEQFTIYKDKKLITEALPSYMFIRPTKEPKPEKEPEDGDQRSRPTSSPRDDIWEDVAEEYFEEYFPDCEPGCSYDDSLGVCACG